MFLFFVYRQKHFYFVCRSKRRVVKRGETCMCAWEDRARCARGASLRVNEMSRLDHLMISNTSNHMNKDHLMISNTSSQAPGAAERTQWCTIQNACGQLVRLNSPTWWQTDRWRTINGEGKVNSIFFLGFITLVKSASTKFGNGF